MSFSHSDRGRLLAKEVKQRKNTEEESANFIASTPPLETVKFLIWDAMTKRVSRNKRLLKRSFNDVNKAKQRSRRVQRFVEQRSTGNVVRLDVYGDTDRGCLETRKSTTSMVLMRAMHIVSKYQVIRNQPTISLSRSESECCGIVQCATIGLGSRSMLADFGMGADLVVRTDSSSGLAVGSRRGLGRLRHVQTRFLWVQQRVQEDLPLEEGAGRHERERRAHQTSGREAHDELVDKDGLRVQRRAHSIGAGSAVTNWR